MSDAKKEQPKVQALQTEYKKLLRVREGMPGNAEALRKDLKEERRVREAEMNAAKARALRPSMEIKTKALDEAAVQYKAVWSRVTQAYEDEVKPAVQRRDALLKEAQRDQVSKVETAKIAFNRAADQLHQDLKVELQEIEQKFQKDLAQLEQQYAKQLGETDSQLEAMKREMERSEDTGAQMAETKGQETQASP